MPKLGRARRELPIAEIERRYLGGDSLKQLSGDYDIARQAIAMRLSERGIVLRGRSAANVVRMNREGAAGRMRLTAAAHAANSGITQTAERRANIAESREANGSYITEDERRLGAMLAARGIPTEPQKAVGRYNLDLAAWPLAIEVFGGKWHWHGTHAATWPKRRDFLLSHGWSVLIVRIDSRTPLAEDTADQVAAWVRWAEKHGGGVCAAITARGDSITQPS